MFASSKLSITIALAAASSALSMPLTRADQACAPSFTEGTGYAVESDINRHSNPSAVYLLDAPENGSWFLSASSTGGWVIGINNENPPVNCVLAPSDSEGDVLKRLTTGACNGSDGKTAPDADFTIECDCAADGSATTTGCVIKVPAHNECVNVPGDSNGDPSVRSAECTGSPQQVWDFVAA